MTLSAEQVRKLFTSANLLSTSCYFPKIWNHHSDRKSDGHCLTHIVEEICPSLHSDALEDGENGKQDVVKLRDSIVRSEPVFPTGCTIWTESRGELSSTWKLFPNFLCQNQIQTFISPQILLHYTLRRPSKEPLQKITTFPD